MSNNTATGTVDFTAANGDVLRTETEGVETSFIPPNESHVTLSATIVGGDRALHERQRRS